MHLLIMRAWRPCRATWGMVTSAYRLQAFLEAVVGQDRLRTVQRDLEAFHAAGHH